MPMDAAKIAFISAVTVLILGKIFDFAAYRLKRKDNKADEKEKEEKIEDGKVLSELRSLRAEIGEVKSDVCSLRTEVETVRSEAEEGRVLERRIRILRFADEITHGQPKHSKDHFQQLMEDCQEYEEYINKHTEFKNGITEPAITLIRDTYNERLKKNDFL